VESKRAGFASKYLFNKTSGPKEIVEEVDEEDSFDNEESYSSADYSNSIMTEGYCSSNFSVAVASPDSSVEPIATPMVKYQSVQIEEGTIPVN